MAPPGSLSPFGTTRPALSLSRESSPSPDRQQKSKFVSGYFPGSPARDNMRDARRYVPPPGSMRTAAVEAGPRSTGRGQDMAIGTAGMTQVAPISSMHTGYQKVNGVSVYTPDADESIESRCSPRFVGPALATALTLMFALMGVAYSMKARQTEGRRASPAAEGRRPEGQIVESPEDEHFSPPRAALVSGPGQLGPHVDCSPSQPGCPLATATPLPEAASQPQSQWPPQTMLTEACGAGSTQIEVGSTSGFDIGDLIKIESQVSSETNTIVGIGSIKLSNPLSSIYPVGSTVTRINGAVWPGQLGVPASESVADQSGGTPEAGSQQRPDVAQTEEAPSPAPEVWPSQTADSASDRRAGGQQPAKFPVATGGQQVDELANCDTVCVADDLAASCSRRILWSAAHTYEGWSNSCEQAQITVVQDCPECMYCSLEASNCLQAVTPSTSTTRTFTTATILADSSTDTTGTILTTSGTSRTTTTLVLRESAPYDCLAGYFNWSAGWPVEKKSWCCLNQGRGCMSYESNTSTSTRTATLTDTITTRTTMTSTKTISATNTASTTTSSHTNTATASLTKTMSRTATTMSTATLTTSNTTSTSTSTTTSTLTSTKTQSTTKTGTATTQTTTRTGTHTATTTKLSTLTTTVEPRKLPVRLRKSAKTTQASRVAPTPLVSSTTPLANRHNSLWCFSLVTPWSEEKLLLNIAFAQNRSIFQCDGYAVYSNPVVELGGLKSRLLGVDLHCPMVTVHTDGISYEAADNQRVFARLWDQVIGDGDFRNHDWTVQVHPDAVFLPDRLRRIVSAEYGKEGPLGNGILINNCKLGLHGALEVVSTRALQVYAAGHQRCKTPHQEDVYLHDCMSGIGVTVVDNYHMLADKFCYRGDWHQTPEWFKCTDRHAAFHPFKSAEAYLICLQAAEHADNA